MFEVIISAVRLFRRKGQQQDRQEPRESVITTIQTGPLLKEVKTLEGSPRHVLVVEDNRLSAQVVQRMLKGLGCEADVAFDGETAVTLVQYHRYDLVFMDIELADIDGYETTLRIRHLEGGKTVPIVALSANAGSEYQKRCIEVGMNAVLSKPVSLEQIKEVLGLFFPEKKRAQPPEAQIEENPLPPAIIDTAFLKNRLQYSHKELVALFEEWFREIATSREALTAACEVQDWERVKKIAHQMRGSSAYCGASRVQRLCAYIEDDVAAGRYDRVSAMCARLAQEEQEAVTTAKDWLKRAS